MLVVMRLLLSIASILIMCAAVEAEAPNISFERYSVSQGLSQGAVNCILQDRLGFIWVGTNDGLNRFDGYRFTVYRNDPRNTDSLANNIVQNLFEDSAGTLWIIMQHGLLSRYNREKDSFTVLRHPETGASLYVNGSSIIEGGNSFLWLCSTDGLIRYERKNEQMKVYRINSVPPETKNRNIALVCKDANGTLWFGDNTYQLHRYDAGRDKFISYPLIDKDAGKDPRFDPRHVTPSYVLGYFADRAGYFWVNTKPGGLYRFDPKSGSFTRLHVIDVKRPEDRRNMLFVFFQDRSGVVWIGGNNNHLLTYDARSGRFTTISPITTPLSAALINSGDISKIIQDETGVVWIASWGGGLKRYDPATGTFTNYRHDPFVSTSLSNDQITTLYQDRAGALWIGTYGGGVCRYDPQKQRFALYRNDPRVAGTLSNSTVNTLWQDRQGTLWVGTRGGGLNRYDAQQNRFVVYRHDARQPASLRSDIVSFIYEDRAGRLWIGTSLGLSRYDARTDSFITYGNSSGLKGRGRTGTRNDLPSLYIHSMAEESTGALLIAYAGGGGLYRYQEETDTLTGYFPDPADPVAISIGDPYCVYVDREGTLWVGDYSSGLNRYDAKQGGFVRYRHDPKDPSSLSNDYIRAIYQDSSGTIWIGTATGLNRYDPVKQSFTHFTESDGLPNSFIQGICEDSEGNLWLSTNKGISKFNPRTLKFINYDVDDGLQGNEFYSPAYHKGRGGEIFFGGGDGFNRFFPEKIKSNTYVPPVLITSFKVFDKLLDKALPTLVQSAEQRQQTPLELSYQQNFFSFEFVALSFTNAEKNQYAYKLEGLDQDWVACGTRRYGSYTNLDPGEYVLRVKASNSDGVWNEQGTSLKIRIIPPPWRQWWAYGLYLACISGIGRLTLEVRRRRLAYKKELSDKELRAEAAELANRAKSVFLANMSHELRTPLNAILGFAQIILRKDRLEQDVCEYLNTIMRSGEHLLGLINDVLSISKIEAGKIHLNLQAFSFHNMLKELETIFHSSATAKGLLFTIEIEEGVPKQVLGDEGKLRQVLINLLGNAVKFTSQGSICLRVKRLGERIQFEVEDTGFGIAAEEQKNLFEPFVQTTSGQKTKESIGLGLSISRNFVRLMGGDITLRSELGKGSTFTFDIEMPTASEVKESALQGTVIGLMPGQPRYRILIVDDKWENRAVLSNLLSSVGFDVQEADDGLSAVAAWQQWQPQLIYMDIRMKIMDGYAATAEIRKQGGVEVVIIALTASIFEHDHERIYNTGCNAIITKPFLEATIFDSLAKHLGVHFRYKGNLMEAPVANKEEVNEQDIARHLSLLSPQLFNQLRSAIQQGRTVIAAEVIDQIEKENEVLAKELRKMLKAYRLEELSSLISAVASETR